MNNTNISLDMAEIPTVFTLNAFVKTWLWS